MKLTDCVYQFFDQYLPQIKGVKHNTRLAYRDTFKLFLPFAAEYLGIKINALEMEHLSCELILDFLDYLEHKRGNIPRTRNQRLAALKSFAIMIRFMHPQYRRRAELIINIPQKRMQRPLVGFLYPDEMLTVFDAVDLKQTDGFRDFTLLHLLADSGARASEVTSIDLNHFDYQQRTLILLGKRNRYRQIDLWLRTAKLLKQYIAKYRRQPTLLYENRLFVNQRREELTRHGIYRICKKYLTLALPPKKLIHLNPAHCFRHSCAVEMLCRRCPITDIKNRLGHDNIRSTMIYLHLDLSRRKQVHKNFMAYIEATLPTDEKLNDFIDWEYHQETLAWLDKL